MNPPPITKPWHALVTSMAEIVVRGKPIAETLVNDDLDSVRSFMEDLANSQPDFVRPLKYEITKRSQVITLFEIVMFTNFTALEVYKKIGDIQDASCRHALYGFMFGYAPDDIWAYIRRKAIAGT